MKTIYTVIGENVYRVNQNTSLPTALTFKQTGASSAMHVDCGNKSVTQNIVINTLTRPGTKSNAEMYRELVDKLVSDKVTEIKEIQNFFKVYIDYTMFEDGVEIEHSAVVRPIKPTDKAILLGVATNNECVYRRVKTFNPNIEFKLRDCLPHGIMKTKRSRYVFKINNMAIFQDFSPRREIHESTYEVPYCIGSTTIQTNLNNMTMIYSTENEGIELQEIALDFKPRTLCISLDMIMANYIVTYNNAEIDKIIIENIKEKYPEDDGTTEAPEEDDDPGILIPDEETKPEADGEYEPNEDGFMDYYELCNETTPGALLVVEDLIPDNLYDVDTMIKVSMVVKDIPEVEVGNYVIYRESFVGLI